MTLYITFSGATYDATTRAIVERAKRVGADAVRVYDDRWLLDQDFYRENQWLWTHPHRRGFGWYAWKPYIIWHALSTLSDGDLVLYTDADTVPIAPLDPLFDQCERDGGIMLFASENHYQADWCKGDCYAVMGRRERPSQEPAGVARFLLFQKGPWRTTQFLMEWLTYCVNRLANTFDPSVIEPDAPSFIEHRAEQAILTNMAQKFGLRLYREACQAGNTTPRDWDLYGQLFEQIDNGAPKVSAEPVGSAYFNVEPRPCAA